MDKVSFTTFDWKVYLSKYPDLQEAGIFTAEAAWRHFRKFGKAEGRTHYQEPEPVPVPVPVAPPPIVAPVPVQVPPVPAQVVERLLSPVSPLEALESEPEEPESPVVQPEAPVVESPVVEPESPVVEQGITITFGEPEPIPVEKKTRKRATKTK